MNLSRTELSAMQASIPERSTAQKLADFRALRADQIRLARSWRNSPIIRDGHLKAARMLQAGIMQLHAIELASALEPAPSEAAEISDTMEMVGMGNDTFELEARHADWLDEQRTQEEARY
jgi:hypothetical protein